MTKRLFAAALLTLAPALAHAQSRFNEDLLKAFTYRNLGPFRMGARTSDIAVPDSPARDHLYTMYVGYWTGGLWKSTNNGTTFEPIFDQQNKLAIGDIAIAPSNSQIVWVGTGDAFTSRSSYAGDGIYKSTDDGNSWQNMGLRDSHHIARIVIHPTNPDIVYAAVMGHLYSTNAERGVFRTTDGGRSWQKVLYIDENIGVIDLVLNLQNPSILYAATYDVKRLPWQIVNGGPQSGIYKTSDGGNQWSRLGGGLPTGRIGRIGLDIYRKNPEILYAVIENANARTAAAPGDRVQTIGGEVYRTENGGQTWTKTHGPEHNASPKGPYYFSQIRVDPTDDRTLIVTGEPFLKSTDGGKTWGTRIFPRMFGDFRTLWFDHENSQRIIIGSDGGIAISYDGGRTSDHYPNVPVAEVYMVGVDMEEPYNIYAGLQDHEHWRGPSNAALGRITQHDWLAVGDNDGIYTQVDPTDSRWLFTTRQYGGHTRVDQKLGYETNITPQRPAGQRPYRFIWGTPIHISPHNPSVIYAGAEVLLRSENRGDSWKEISPDLSTNDTTKILRESEGGVPGGIPWFAISTISESPVTAGLIWVGTSDGKVQFTRNGGQSWSDMTPKLKPLGARAESYVSRVRASSHVAGRAYVAKSGYKYDDFTPYLYRTDDFGATWTSISSNLPREPINVVFEDPKNPNLLYVGNDHGLYVSLNRGGTWVRMQGNMPSIPIHDLVVHPRDNDLVLGSYGRGIFVTSINALQQLNEAVLESDAHLFDIEPTVQRVTHSFGANDYLFGQRHFQTQNEPSGMMIRYYLKNASAPVSIVIADSTGKEVAKLEGPGAAGIQTVTWNTRKAAATGSARGGIIGSPIDQLVPLGEYRVTLQAAGQTIGKIGRIVRTQGWTIGPVPQVIR